MERGLSFGSRGPQSDFARLCWRVRIQNNNHQRHATTQGVSHAAVKHPARFRGLRAPHALYCAHQPNSAVKPTPTSSACGCPPCFALRRGLPRALGEMKWVNGLNISKTFQKKTQQTTMNEEGTVRPTRQRVISLLSLVVYKPPIKRELPS